MAFTNFSIGVLLAGVTGSNPNQAQTFQIVTPWGQSNVCYTWEEAVNQVIVNRNRFSGVMGAYFNNSTTNGISGSGTAPPLSATNIFNTP